jgi:hypothetical protein
VKRVYICAPGEASQPEHFTDLERHVLAAIDAKVTPVNATLMFERVVDALDRQELFVSSVALIAACDELWVFGAGDVPPSTRQINEMTTAGQLGIPIIAKTVTSSAVPALFDEPRAN